MLATLIFCLPIMAQKSSETIKGNYPIQKTDNYSEVQIKNFFGSVTIESYKGNDLILEATKTIISEDEKGLEKGKNEIELVVYEHDQGVFVYLDHPCAIFDQEKLLLNYDCNDHGAFLKKEYEFNMDIVVKIPNTLNFVNVSTIDKGDVYIRGLQCELDASNVNGSLTVIDHSGNIEASTVNGDLMINFLNDPESYADFNTINGDIEVKCSKNLSARVNYKSMHGDFFTDYSDISFLPAEIIVSESKKTTSTKYRLSSVKSFSIGGGNTKFSFKTLNGDMYLRSN